MGASFVEASFCSLSMSSTDFSTVTLTPRRGNKAKIAAFILKTADEPHSDDMIADSIFHDGSICARAPPCCFKIVAMSSAHATDFAATCFCNFSLADLA